MDEMRVKISTNFMKNIISKMITKVFNKKYGCKMNIRINDLDVWIIDGDTNIKLNVEAKLSSEEFKRIMKSIDNE